MDISLNPLQVQKISGKIINVIKYSELCDYVDANHLFSKSPFILLLYETQKNNGHWVCLIDKPKTIYVFDSYGIFPDDELKYTNIKFRKDNNMDFGYLSYLLYHSPKTIDYNAVQLQKLDQNITTCGRWCGLRIRCDNLSNDKFAGMFKHVPLDKRDNVICQLTEKYLNIL